MKKPLAIFLGITVVLLMVGCSSESKKISNIQELNQKGIKIGSVEATAASRNLESNPDFEEAEKVTLNLFTDGILAVKTGKIDAFCYDEPLLKGALKTNTDLKILPEAVSENKSVIAARKSDTELIEQVNQLIERYESDGTFEKMKERWLSGDDVSEMPADVPVSENPAKTIKVGMSSAQPPFAYLGEDKVSLGYEAELAMRIAYDLGYGVEIVNMEWIGLIPALEGNKIDLIISTLSHTPERAETLALSEPYLTVDVKMMVKK